MMDTVEIPFLTLGNESVLTDKQVHEEHFIAEFIERWKHCFEHDPLRQVWLYRP